MRFTIRFLSRKAAACALFALSPLSTYAQDAPAPETHGIVVANMDRSVKPGDDFYRYANGDWIKRTEVPSDRSSIGVNDSLVDLSQKRVAGLIEEAAKANAPAGSNTRKIADLYHSYMDEAAIEAKGSLRSVHSSTLLLPSGTSANWRGLWARASGRISML